MYPTVVIVLVETQRSMADVCEIGPSNASKLGAPVKAPVAPEAHPATFGHLSFAVGPVHSTAGDGVESQCSRVLQNQGGPEHGLEEVIREVKESQVGTNSSCIAIPSGSIVISK